MKANAKKSKKKDNLVPFRDKNGKEIRFPESMTIAELVRIGVKDIGIVDPKTPMKEGEFRTF